MGVEPICADSTASERSYGSEEDCLPLPSPMMLLMGGLGRNFVTVYVTHLYRGLPPLRQIGLVCVWQRYAEGGTSICGEVEEVDDGVRGVDRVRRSASESYSRNFSLLP